MFMKYELFRLHTNCRQNIMHEKCGHSMANDFEIKMTVKSGAVEIDFKSWGPFKIY